MSGGIHEKQKPGRIYGRRQTSLAFGSGWTALGCIDPNSISNNNNNNNNKFTSLYKIFIYLSFWQKLFGAMFTIFNARKSWFGDVRSDLKKFGCC